jgi:hypothetical protein
MAEIVFTKEDAKAQPHFEFALENWRMRDFNAFTKAMGEFDFAACAELSKAGILAWPFAGSPSDPLAWEDLKITEVASITKALKNAISVVFSEGN